MICPKCGVEIPDNSIFCTGCGEKIEAEVVADTPAETPVEAPVEEAAPSNTELVNNVVDKAKKNPVLFIAIAAGATVLIVLLCVLLFGGRSYKSVVKKSIKATFKADGDAYLDLIHDDMLDYMLEDDDMSRKEAVKQVETGFKLVTEALDEKFDDWSWDYKILDVEDASKSELRDIKNTCEDEYELKVKDAKTITVKLTIEGDGDRDSDTMRIEVIKIGRSWYLWESNLF